LEIKHDRNPKRNQDFKLPGKVYQFDGIKIEKWHFFLFSKTDSIDGLQLTLLVEQQD
jgi:hypothetical protein